MKKILNLTKNQKISICGEEFEVLSKTVYMTQTSTDEYVKYILSGHKILVVIPTDNMIYLGTIVEPFEQNQTFSDEIIFNSISFSKVASDYQVVKCVEFGNPQEVEGEVVWADYANDETPETYISCAYVPKTNSRADIVGKILEIGDIKI